ncbi:MAG: DsbA family protein [Candidatus Rokubacteria bacterium]|nr:DsbA family protein [Candidatus Rokubacteria bacterium]
MRLRRLRSELGDRLRVEWRAFPLRPVPDPTATFKGTYREEAWKRCRAFAEPDGIVYNLWARDDYPNWSLPALEAAKCVALQGEAAFERLHLRLYAAFFADGRNIANPDEVAQVVSESGADMARFRADLAGGKARAAVLSDYEDAVTQGVRAIPTVVLNGGRRIVGLVDFAEYRRVVSARA